MSLGPIKTIIKKKINKPIGGGMELTINNLYPKEFKQTSDKKIKFGSILINPDQLDSLFNCFDFTFERICDPLTNAKCSIVTFNIGRWGRTVLTIHFTKQVSQEFAVQVAERWLSQKMTRQHFAIIKKDLFASIDDVEPKMEEYSCFGDALGEAKYLERIECNTKLDAIKLLMGS